MTPQKSAGFLQHDCLRWRLKSAVSGYRAQLAHHYTSKAGTKAGIDEEGNTSSIRRTDRACEGLIVRRQLLGFSTGLPSLSKRPIHITEPATISRTGNCRSTTSTGEKNIDDSFPVAQFLRSKEQSISLPTLLVGCIISYFFKTAEARIHWNAQIFDSGQL